MDVQTQLSALKASFDKKDYAAVVTGAPAVLAAAQSLATAAAEKKDEVLKALNDKWTALAGSVPGYMTAIQNRIDFLGQKGQQKSCRGHRCGWRKIRLERCHVAVVQGAGGIRRRQPGRGGKNRAGREVKDRAGRVELKAGSFRAPRQVLTTRLSQGQSALADDGRGARDMRRDHAALVDFEANSDLSRPLHLVALTADESRGFFAKLA